MNPLLKSFIAVFFIFLNLANAKLLIFTDEEKQYIKNNTLKVGMLPDFYPFSFQTNGQTKGYSYDLIKLISQKSHLKLEFVFDNWTNNIHNLKNEKIDIIDSISYTKQRSQYINFSEPYYEVPLVLYSRKSSNYYNGTLKSLKNKKIGIVNDIFYAKALRELNNFNLVYFNSSAEKNEALASGQIDFAIGSLLTTKKIIRDGEYKNLKILDELNFKGLKKEDLRFGVHKNNPILYSIVNKTYNNLTQNEKATLQEKWLSLYSKSLKASHDNEIQLNQKEQNYLKTKKVIRMCNLNSFAPIEFANEKGYAVGISVDTIRLIEKKLNYQIMIQHINTTSDEEAKDFFKRRICDILPISMPIEKFKVKYTIPYLKYEAVVITRIEEPFIRSLDDIKYKGIAYKNNPTAIRHIKNTYPGITLIKTQTHKESFKKVSAGEIYSTLTLLPIASYNINKYGFSNLKIAGHAKNDVEFSMAVNTEDNLLLGILNKSLNAITQKEKAVIFNKWANIEYDKQINYSTIINIVMISVFIIILLIYRQVMLSKNNEKLQKAKDKLEESNNRIIDILESTVESILISKDGIITECNKMATYMFGYSKKEMMGMSLFELIHDDSHPFVKRKQKSKRTKPYEIDILNKQKDVIAALVRGSDIYINGQKHRVSTILELTQLKLTQKALEDLNKDLALKIIEEVEKNKKKDLKLLHQARHAQMGELINMIAHQWRQPLNAIAATIMNIQLQLSLEKYDLSNQDEREQFSGFLNIKLENIENFIQTLSITIDDFRNFYKQDNETKQESVHIPIKKALDITKALILSKKITVIKELNSIKKIEIFESELLQVFLNIIKNAQDNFEDQDISEQTITITTKDTALGVTIEIYDNGGGINPEIMDHIFDPYFSTKDIKNGTGLGLYMSKSIIEKHHKGKFYAHNTEEGVCFTLEFHDTLNTTINLKEI